MPPFLFPYIVKNFTIAHMPGSAKSEHIPRATIQRLAVYVNLLESLAQNGEKIISSEGLARACGVNPSQIR